MTSRSSSGSSSPTTTSEPSRRRSRCAAVLACVVLSAAWGCTGSGDDPAASTVVVYTALDQVHSEPILREFERRTGIKVLPVYDAEAAKTTGLVNRLIARRERPDCDVFWNNEVVQTERLATLGILEPYASPSATRIPERFRDPGHRWTGFAARMRVLICNTDLIPAERTPRSLAAFTDPAWRGRAAVARPFYGTTLTHMAVLHEAWGPERLSVWLAGLRENQVALCPGNGPVRDMVASGERAFGLTDTDDAYAGLQAGKPVAIYIPDADQGAVLIPNTVALVAGAPHPGAARRLIDYLLSADVERRLAQGAGAQVPLGTDLADLPTPWHDLEGAKRPMEIDVSAAAGAIDPVVALLREQKMDE